MLSKKEILTIFSKTKPDDSWSFKETKPSDRGKWTHSYHRYPAKFIPQIVEKLLDEYIHEDQKNVRINDPFFGCGTTIVSAISRGYYVSGTDINKIANLITKVKATPIQPSLLRNKVEDFLARIKTLKSNQTSLLNDQTMIKKILPEKHLERISYWFKDEMIEKLSEILGLIEEENNTEIRDFLKIGFSNCLKNCSIWLMSSTKPTRDLKKKIPEPYTVFKRHLNKMVRGNEAFYKVIPEKVRENIHEYLNITNADARNQLDKSNTVDLTITSSPYVTSYEYADLHQLSTLWLDLTDDLIAYRKNFIGTSYKKYENVELKSSIAKDVVKKLVEKDKKLSKNAEAFYIDMQEVLEENYRILKKGGRCCYVIGNTRLRKVDIFNAEIFAELMQHSGFKFDKLIKREIHSKLLPQLRDEKTGQFASNDNADSVAYPVEYIVIGLKS